MAKVINQIFLTGSDTSGGSISGNYEVVFVDIDGTEITRQKANSGQAVDIPNTNPYRPNLTFDGWAGVSAITNNKSTPIQNDLIYVALYTPEENFTRIRIKITKNSFNKTIVLKFRKNNPYTYQIYWGDDEYWENLDGSGASVQISHTYAENGEYTIRIVTPQQVENTYGILGPLDSYSNDKVLEVNFASNVDYIDSNIFSQASNLEIVSFPKDSLITSLPANCFNGCYNIRAVGLPDNIRGILGNAFYQCYSLKYIAHSSRVYKINTSVCGYCYSLKYFDMSKIDEISNSAFAYSGAEKIKFVKNLMPTTSTYIFRNCFSLREVELTYGLTTLSANMFNSCYSLKRFVCKSNIASIESNCFVNCLNMKEYDFTNCTAVPTLATTTSITVGRQTIIKVPSALVDDWKVATNWSTFANYIIGV